MSSPAVTTWLGRMTHASSEFSCDIAIISKDEDDIASTVLSIEALPDNLKWSEGPLRIDEWSKVNGTDHELFELGFFLDSKTPYALIIRGKSQDVPSADNRLDLNTLGRVEPLDDQFGIFPEKTIPDDLQDTFFAENMGSLYAVVDTALIPDLATRLPNEDVEYRCLFKGKAADDFKDVAPYLIRFGDHDRLLRDFLTLTKQNYHWHYYQKDACLFLRSDANFDTLWAHLRKFTKIRDHNDKWFYLRFWDPMFRTYLIDYPQGPFPRDFFNPIQSVICRLDGDQWVAVRKKAKNETFPSTSFFPQFRRHCRLQKRQTFIDNVGKLLVGHHNAEVPETYLKLLYRQARDRGYWSERGLAKQMETLFLIEQAGLSEATVLSRLKGHDVESLADATRAGVILDATLELIEEQHELR
ncbi:DUF4123 domain-containing protein [Parasulfitobacter algicola]|uniref:DUF4123 domain-containing protein n=1 Tax=Parasulfitobacter algicola TaxID=2614809 RepID=A0ABX2IVQ4_9RHOB|nr:DUF4123 domain-containing protein [Sulfitobacter algicola]NSX57016.1 DUF4123 domain-containing protein [Sulfitobacter algicola]